ncbi:uncharacterized protein METZ01_LOCUS446454 [marine metagenome]|uniref:Uncharacterized protein n=1 Tax=marine metagenome TaxID=408172 RepID=A0A382ZE71_9ZZZZ
MNDFLYQYETAKCVIHIRFPSQASDSKR